MADALREVVVNGVRYFQAADVERWHRRLVSQAKHLDELEEEAARCRRTLDAIRQNARSWHALEDGKERALNVIGNWAEDALAGRLHPSAEKLTAGVPT